MDQCGYDFVIMMKAFVRELLLGNRGSFENIRERSIRKYRVSGTTVKSRLYEGERKERYFPIFYSDQKASVEHEQIEAK